MHVQELILDALPALASVGLWGYWIVGVSALLESIAFVGILYPGGLIILLGGAAAGGGYLDVPDLIWFTAIGAIIGDCISFYLGRHGGQLLRRYTTLIPPEYFERGHHFFEKHGNKSILLGRFLGPLRAIVPVIAGASGMRPKTFIAWDVASALAWGSVYILIGYFFGSALSALGVWTNRIGAFVVSIAAVGALIWYMVKEWHVISAFLKSRYQSARNAILKAPRIALIESMYPALFSFFQARFSRNSIGGLPLTISSAIIALLVLTVFSFTESVVESDFIVRIDQWVLGAFVSYREPLLVEFFLGITQLASISVAVVFSLSFIAWLLVRKKTDYVMPFLIAFLGTQGSVYLMKELVERVRPGAEYILFMKDTLSFPSGHAASAMVIFGFIAYVAVRQVHSTRLQSNIAGTAVIVIGLVALSRLYLGFHFLSDVIGGLLIGFLWLLVGAGIAEIRRHRHDRKLKTGP